MVNLFLVGAPKCGTTSLFNYLIQSKEIGSSSIKEPYYFADDFPKIRKLSGFECSKNEYEKHFNFQNTYNIDASVWYLYSKTAIQNIHNYNPNAKIIVMLRNPVEMVYSLYSQHRHRFEKTKSFEKAWRNSKKKRHAPLFMGEIDEELFDYQSIGLYSEQLQRLFSIFDRENIKVILFDDFSNNTLQEYNKVMKFLSLKPKKNVNLRKANVNYVERYNLITTLINHLPDRFVSNLKGIKRSLLRGSSKSFFIKKIPRKPLTKDFESELKMFYRTDIEELEKILNISLKCWK